MGRDHSSCAKKRKKRKDNSFWCLHNVVSIHGTIKADWQTVGHTTNKVFNLYSVSDLPQTTAKFVLTISFFYFLCNIAPVQMYLQLAEVVNISVPTQANSNILPNYSLQNQGLKWDLAGGGNIKLRPERKWLAVMWQSNAILSQSQMTMNEKKKWWWCKVGGFWHKLFSILRWATEASTSENTG